MPNDYKHVTITDIQYNVGMPSKSTESHFIRNAITWDCTEEIDPLDAVKRQSE